MTGPEKKPEPAGTEAPKRYSEKHAEARAALPAELLPTFDALVEEYRFYAFLHHRTPFVSYVVLADLVRSGWRPSAEPVRKPPSD